MINVFICKILNDLSDRGKFEKTLVICKNQTANGIVDCPEIMNSYIENPGFPDFVEVIR